jgi:hypothetical protein
MSKPCSSVRWIRRPSVKPAATPHASVETTTNSSPASRAIMSLPRTTLRMRVAAWVRSSSPALWPSVSLTRLKPSRSMNRTTIAGPPDRIAAVDAARCSFSASRFGSPVNGSRRA